MGKIFNSVSSYVLAGIIVIVVLFILLLRSCSSGSIVHATITPSDPIIGQEVFFSDSTSGAVKWKWEFGDGTTSDKQSGRVVFREPGKYKVRLTVDDYSERFFEINVGVNPTRFNDHLVSIIAPYEAVQGENIVFRGEGPGEQWRWEFGESGMVDAREKTTIYSYSEPGLYDVLLTTEKTRYPIKHTINILPLYSESDSTDVMTLIALDIKEKLQAVADSKPFNINYNYIVNKYLCKNERTEVMINNNKYNDIYSYCQGLRMAGKGKTSIEKVLVEIPNIETGCVTRIIVIQIDK